MSRVINNKLAKITQKTGCYLFKNKAGKIIYIGKAKNLKKRILSYFKLNIEDIKIKQMVKQVSDIDFIITDNEVEVLLMEAQLIKKYQPKYNINLKDDKYYAYIKITAEKFPRLTTVRQPKKDDRVFGPYPSGSYREEGIRLANSLFKLRVCKKLPKNPCLLYHIHQCLAPCIGKISEFEYSENIKKAVELLKGNTYELIRKLEAEMKRYSDAKNYELAKIRRDQIIALNYISERQKVQLKKIYDQDVINYLRNDKNIYVQIFNINKGVISGRKEFKFNQDVKLNTFIVQYYYGAKIPNEIILPEKIEDQNLVIRYLEKQARRQVKITIPQKGDKLKLLKLLKENILVHLKVGDSALLELQNKLNLPTLPRVIECFDVSNFGDQYIVGASVNFLDGKPDKNNYRRFKIKTVFSQSDFASVKEIIYRRYYRLKAENLSLPNLIVIDGGKPQLSAALFALRELGLQIPVIALAKKEEEIFMIGRAHPLKLPKKSSGLKILQRIRNEAHRFAISYSRLLHSKL